MAIEFKLPELGEGIDSGDVLTLFVQEGDVLRAKQAVMELETDKATVEVPCPQAGKVVKLHVAEGQTLKIGAPILTLEPMAAASAGPAPTTAAPTTAASTTPPAAVTPSATVASAGTGAATAPASRAAPADDAPVAPAGPATRRFARELGVDLARVHGSGPAGRITRDDVVNVVRHLGTGTAAEVGIRTAEVGTSGAGLQPTSSRQPPTTSHQPPSSPPGEPDTDAWGPIRREIASRVRRTIAAKMHESWSTIPRVTNFDDADITELEQHREESKEDYARTGIKLTTMPFLMKAVAISLRKHPLVNAAYDHEHGVIVYKDYVHLGIAVDTDRGLVVPVVRNADRLTIAELARQLAEIVQAARANSFKLEDLRGGTFSISNLGSVGGTYSTPIINFPEVAILLAGRARKLPVVVNDEIAIRLMLPLSLSYDHRLVDGATAARFLNDVIGYLQSPTRLLLAP